MSKHREDDLEFAERVANADDRIVRVLVIGRDGELLAVVTPKTIPESDQPPADELNRRGAAFAIAYGAAEGATAYLGRMQFTVFAYEGYKVLLMRVAGGSKTIAVRLPRMINAEDVYHRVTQVL